jgi:hypothetical protein
MRSTILALVIALWSASAVTASAQLFESGAAAEPDGSFNSPSMTSQPGISGARRNGTVHTLESLCPLIESAAVEHGLPIEFFARLIWQESRLRPDALGPATRTGGRAQGIAQFMPATAAERLLLDPFEPNQALAKSAEFLRELRSQFGSVGLAAAAYNAGPRRVYDWLAGKRPLPSETLAYVRIVTGRSAEEWKRPEAAVWKLTIPSDTPCLNSVKLPPKPPSQTQTTTAHHRANALWAVQLVADRSESNALASYDRLQKKHPSILGAYQPVVVRTMAGLNTEAIWHRVRVELDNRSAAETICSRLRTAGGSCAVQRN